MGYDISDYKNIDERYGTLEDWDALVADLHSRGMKLMCVPSCLLPLYSFAYTKTVRTGWTSW